MSTVFDQLADAFTRRKQALAERERPASKLAGSDYFMSQSAKQDLANRLSVFEQGGTPELLKQAAQETYQNPAVNAAIGFTPVIGDLQSAFEAVKAAKEGQWAEAGLNALGVLPFVPALKTTWHGSPHKYARFDMSKIGTGEGAQACGHGLYLADVPEVAKEYTRTLRDPGFAYNGVKIDRSKNTIQHEAAKLLYENGGDKIAAKKAAETYAYDNLLIPEIEKLDPKLVSTGNLYKVDLPDEHIAKMLDWDSPLTKHGNIDQLREIAQLEELPVSFQKQSLLENRTGSDYYNALVEKLGSPKAASNVLNSYGIPGIRYLDQGSRGAGEGTRNYVVFNENIPTILERNGLSVFDIPKD